MTRIFVPVAADDRAVVDLSSYARRREQQLEPLIVAVRRVLNEARGFFRREGFVTSFILCELADEFPGMKASALVRQIRYALNVLEDRGEAERVQSMRHHRATGKDVEVTRWRRTR